MFIKALGAICSNAITRATAVLTVGGIGGYAINENINSARVEDALNQRGTLVKEFDGKFDARDAAIAALKREWAEGKAVQDKTITSINTDLGSTKTKQDELLQQQGASLLEVDGLRKDHTTTKSMNDERIRDLESRGEENSKTIVDVRNALLTGELDKGIYKTIAPASCTISGEKNLGSGGYIEVIDKKDGQRKTVILSADHLTKRAIRDPLTGEVKLISNAMKDGTYKVRMYNGDDYKKAPIFYTKPIPTKYNEEYDLTIFEGPKDKRVPTLPLRNLTRNPLEVTQTCYKVGAGNAFPDTFGKGRITHLDTWTKDANASMYVTDMTVNGGDSGSLPSSVRITSSGDPVVEVIGVVLQKNPTADNTAFFANSQRVKEFLERNGFEIMESDERTAWHGRETLKFQRQALYMFQPPVHSFNLLPALAASQGPLGLLKSD